MSERDSDPELTPRERLIARGYTLDEHGNTVELGHDRDGSSKNQAAALFHRDPWEWLEAQKPDLSLRCQFKRRSMARVWLAPSEELWYRAGVYSGRVIEWEREGSFVPVPCTEHGLSLVPTAFLWDWVKSRHKQTVLRCNDRPPVYPRPT